MSLSSMLVGAVEPVEALEALVAIVSPATGESKNKSSMGVDMVYCRL